jgi:hypothetical protein
MSWFGNIANKALGAVASVVKEAVVDAVKNVATDVGKQFVDTIGKGIKDVASDVIGKGAKIVGDLIKNPLDALKDLGQKLIPPQFQMFMEMGKTIMQAATQILQKFMGDLNLEARVGVGSDGVKAEVSVGTKSAGDAKGAEQTKNSGQTKSSAETKSSGETKTRQADESQRGGSTKAGGSGDPVQTKTGTSGGDITKMAELLRKDPDAFAKQYGDLSPNELLALETKMKSMDRLFSSMSNMLAVEHDTKKALISNMRV